MQVNNPLDGRDRTDLAPPPPLDVPGLAGQPADGGGTQSMDQSRIDAIRGKILSGAYHSLATAEHVARCILLRGDLSGDLSGNFARGAGA